MEWRHIKDGPENSDEPFLRHRARSVPLYDIRLPEGVQPSSFYFTGSTFQLPFAFLSKITATAQILDRSTDFIRTHPADLVSIFILTAGRVEANYDGLQTELTAGDVLFLDYGRPIFSRATDFSALSIALIRERAPIGLRDRALHGTVLREASGSARLLRRVAEATLDVIADVTISQGEAAVDALLELSAKLFDDAGRQPVMPPLNEVTLQNARDLIRERLGDPRLTPTTLARDLKLSRPLLYRLFEPFGGVSSYILRSRLDASLVALVSQPQRPGLIAAVARDHGFTTSARYSRTFRARFQHTPSAILALRSNPAAKVELDAWLHRQASLADFKGIAIRIDQQGIGGTTD